MSSIDSDKNLLVRIFKEYIFKNPINRKLFFPVLFTMIAAKYLEVLNAKQTEKLSIMIKSSEQDSQIIVKYAFILIISAILVEVQALLICRAGQIGARISNRDAFRYFLDLEPDKFGSLGKGEIQNSITRKSQAVQDMIDVFTLNFFPTFLTIFFVSYEAFKNLGLKIVITINVCVYTYAFLTIKITEWRNSMRKSLNSTQNEASNILMDSLYNFDTIFTYKSEDIEVKKYDKSLKKVEHLSTELARSLYVLNLCQKGVWCIMSISVIVLSCYFSPEMIKIEKFTFLLFITGLVMKSMDNMGYMYGKFKTALINARLSFNVAESTKVDGYRTAVRLSHNLSIKNLSIRRGNKNIINNVSLDIMKGDKIAVIGKNGCGKSTLLKAIVKLGKYDGEIIIDDINLNDMSDSSMMNLITYIPQNAILFDNTIMENVKYGNSKIFDEEVYRVSKELGVHDSILKLEGKYSTQVGEQGKLLSGGERQKILILRSVLRESSIIIMDESTASLDKISELKIFNSILKAPDQTVIAIVHNLELLPLFEKILLIEDGKARFLNSANRTSIDLENTK